MSELQGSVETTDKISPWFCGSGRLMLRAPGWLVVGSNQASWTLLSNILFLSMTSLQAAGTRERRGADSSSWLLDPWRFINLTNIIY